MEPNQLLVTPGLSLSSRSVIWHMCDTRPSTTLVGSWSKKLSFCLNLFFVRPSCIRSLTEPFLLPWFVTYARDQSNFNATKSGRKLILQRNVPYSLLTGFMDAQEAIFSHQGLLEQPFTISTPTVLANSEKVLYFGGKPSECHFAELLVAIHICWRRRPSSLRSTSLCETRDSLWSLQNRQRNDKSKERRTSQTAHFQTVYWPS